MKKKLLILVLFSLISSLFAASKKNKSVEYKMNVLPERSSVVTDLVSYKDTVYETICSVSKVDFEKIDVYINKYIDGIYDSTLSIDIPKSQFSNADFNIPYHNQHVKLFVTEENEFCLFLIADKIINFLKIQDDKIVIQKSYELEKGVSSISKISFNGLDRFYYSGGNKNSSIICFDLEGNVIVNKFLNLKDNYEIYLAPVQDYVYGILRTFYTKETFSTIIKFSKDLEILDYYPYNLNEDNSPSYISILSNLENNLYLQCSYYGKNENGTSAQYYVKLTPEKENIISYYLDFDDTFHIQKNIFNNDDINIIGLYMSSENYVNNLLNKEYNYKTKIGLVNVDKDLNITEYEYSDETRFYSFDITTFNDKIFMSGTYELNNDNFIKKVAYNKVFSGKKQVKSKNKIVIADINPFEETEKYLEMKKKISDKINISDSTINEIECSAKLKSIKLNWSNLEPDDEKILSTIPSFHNANEGR